jgi:LmbE family N-acetylglucosaminyl deacetylase
MNFTQPNADLYIPDGLPETEALARTTHLGIGAHQDDLEFMAFHGILAGYDSADQWFGGVTCTDGAGSARTGEFAGFTDEEMKEERRKEQRKAADIGQYGFMAQLDLPSAHIKDPADTSVVDDLVAILRAAKPRVVYTHNPADKHVTHIAVFAGVLRALRQLAPEERPEQLIGCEVWRGLDWMPDNEKVPMDVSGNLELAQEINGVFASQIAGGKRYDLATIGRRRANATFFESHQVDASDQIWFGMDLTPLMGENPPSVADYVKGPIDRFAADVAHNLTTFLPEG